MSLVESAPHGLLVFAGYELDVRTDAQRGFDIASALPRRIMGTCLDSSVTWGKEGDHVICLGEMAAGEDASDLPESSSPASSSTSLGSSVPWGKEGDECVICLGEMVAGEEVSDLPGCNHTFHLQCVAKWLHTKVAAQRSGCCPACNSVIVSPVASRSQPVAGTQAAPHATCCGSHCSDRCKLLSAVVLFLLAMLLQAIAIALLLNSLW